MRDWDAPYVALAEALGANLVTTDRRLAAAQGPPVRSRRSGSEAAKPTAARARWPGPATFQSPAWDSFAATRARLRGAVSPGRAGAPRITLKELAARAGLHPSTVSRVATGDPRLRIAASTRERVERLLRETSYRPHAIARGLKLRRSFVLAVVVPDVTNPLFGAIFRGVEDGAIRRGYGALLCNTDGDPGREGAQLELVLDGRADGVVLASAVLADPNVRRLRLERVPHVLVNRYSDRAGAFVGCDDFAGARLATGHLIGLGHRRVGHLAGRPRVSTSKERLRGYRAALRAAGLAFDPGLVAESGYLEEGGLLAARRLLGLPAGRRPTALFAVNDLAALGAYAAARELGLRIPGDLAVVGYNDVFAATLLSPPLSSVRVPAQAMGAAAATILVDEVEGRLAGAPEPAAPRLLFDPQLVIRESSGH